MTYLNQLSSLALQNKYTKWYCSIIERARSRATTRKEAKLLLGYTEEHHILPKSFKLGGEKDKLNYAYLTAREHLLCHLLMARMFTGQFKIKMCFALHSMYRISKRNKQIRLSSWEYQQIREASSYAKSNSPGSFSGKKHRLSTIEVMRNKRLGKPTSPEQLKSVSKIVEIDGIRFPSASEASRQLGLKKITLIKRVNNPNFATYKYIDIA